MKKLVLCVLLVLGLSSCGYHTTIDSSVKFQVIDTTDVHNLNTLFTYTNYDVIIKIDSSFFSAKVNRFGQLYEITRKLKIKN